jgi:WxcM-like, C-terminal
MNQFSAADPLAAWTLVDIPLVHDRRGSLCFAEANRHVPFAIERVYWIYGMSGGMQRGRHAHLSVQELLVATTGTFDVHCDNGFERATVHLDDPSRGLLVDSGVWRELDAFSAGSVCLVLASGPYEEQEYVRNYSTFAALARAPLRPRQARAPLRPRGADAG